ncbi:MULTISPECIES: rRNA maturation RNase YbeY [Cysteiniphilum]|uniref:rRNA maturation RNase YbeY n=1 Tax=Cysteiniphilum TaxID=2056696 RepID=UPI001CE36739|nr:MULTISPECIES: rRNA maturation RNase YbeY [Cysteiniphilum]
MTMLEIDINNPRALYLPDEDKLNTWAEYTLKFLNKAQAIISIEVVNSDEMQHYNNNYRAKDKPTNILSFPFEAPPGLPKDNETEHFLGDLIICPEVLQKEAKEQHKLLDAHWCHILIHGILHLVGYDHIDEEDALEMESIEIALLAELGVDNPYVEK